MQPFIENNLYIFVTGCLFMALVYHSVLSVIQRNRLLLYYSAYLFSVTLFLTERTMVNFVYRPKGDWPGSLYFNIFDEPIQMLLYFTYIRFAAKAIELVKIPDKKFIIIYKATFLLLVLYSVAHIAAISFGFFKSRPDWAFVGIRILLLGGLGYILFGISKWIHGFFYKIIIAGSIIMVSTALLAFATTLASTSILGISGVLWTCVGVVLDVICFSAALGYKTRRDFLDKQQALRQLLLNEKQMQLQEMGNLNAIYEARESDRNRIAKDLHDDIGSTLSSIHIYSSIAERSINESPEKMKSILKKITESARIVMENMSDIVWAMQKEQPGEKTFINKIKNFGQELLAQKSIECRYEIADDATGKLKLIDARKNILLIVKEAMNNIVKYSEATHAEINISSNESHFLMHITDDGKGFDTTKSQNGNGLKNMKMRTELLGGVFCLSRPPTGGTCILCKIPLTNISDIVNSENI